MSRPVNITLQIQPYVSLGVGRKQKNEMKKEGKVQLWKNWDISVFYFSVEVTIFQLKSNRIF